LVEYNSEIGRAIPSNDFGPAASAYGGGIVVMGGTVTLSSDVIENNTATGGANADGEYPGGNAYGAGLYVRGGTVTLCDDTPEFNTATGGQGTNGSANGQGFGGGIYIVSGATVYIDTFTFNNTINNNPDNIEGPYTPQNC
jgi:hypothetical protein